MALYVKGSEIMNKDMVNYETYHAEGRTSEFDDTFEQLRAKSIRDVLRWHQQLNSAKKVVDIGAGEGRYIPVWQREISGVDLTVVEYSKIASERSVAKFPSVKHVMASAEDLPLPDNTYDALVTVEVIEHVPDDMMMLKECFRVLRPGGWALISTPCGNAGSYESKVNRRAGQLKVLPEGIVVFGKTEDPTHVRRYLSDELIRRCEAVGFEFKAKYFNIHFFGTLANNFNAFILSRVNLRRRSLFLSNLFNNLVVGIGMLDWVLFRNMSSGSTMIILVGKPEGSR